jgi:hypothetical protein
MRLVLSTLLLLLAAVAAAARNDTYDLKTMNAHRVSTLRRIDKVYEVYWHAICTPMHTGLALQLRDKKNVDTRHLEEQFVEDFEPTADKYDLCIAPFEDELHRISRVMLRFFENLFKLNDTLSSLLQKQSKEDVEKQKQIEDTRQLYAVRNLTVTPPLVFLADQTTAFSISQLKTAKLMEENSQVNWPLLFIFAFVLALSAVAAGVAISTDDKLRDYRRRINDLYDLDVREREESIWHSLLSFNKLQTIKCTEYAKAA